MTVEYARDSKERMPYEYYMDKYKCADPIEISKRLGILCVSTIWFR